MKNFGIGIGVVSAAALIALGVVATARANRGVVAVIRAGNACRFEDAWVLANALETQGREEDVLKARLLLQLNEPVAARALLTKWKDPADEDLKILLVLAGDSAGGAGADKALLLGAEAVSMKGAAQEARLIEALQLDPTLTGALYNLACVRSQQGRVAEAATLIRQAWKEGFRNFRKLKADPDLAQLRAAGSIDDLLQRPDDESRCGTW